MKKLSFIDKLIFVVNSIFSALLLFSNLIPYISPKSFPAISILSLATPGLIAINLIFAIYWVVRLRKQFILSLVVLAISYTGINALYQISEKEVFMNDDVKILSYNVRVFNIYNWKKEGTQEILKKIQEFVNDKDPDIICFQEFNTRHRNKFEYKYKYVKENYSEHTTHFGMAIYSKYKVINKGSLDFKNSSNNTIFVDIIKNKDTVRVYNVHLESQKIQLKKENLNEKERDKVLKRLQNTFAKQVDQVNKIVAHEEKCKYKTIICGDFNNTAFSWAYHKLKDEKKDAFIEAGKNFGKSYDFMLPARIDYILVDESFEVNNFKTYDVELSDHYPIMARINASVN